VNRFKWAVVVLAGCALAALVYAAGKASAEAPAATVVRAQRFVLVDSEGRERAELGLVQGGPCLRLLDNDGKPRAALMLASDGSPQLSLKDGNSQVRAVLGCIDLERALTSRVEKRPESSLVLFSKSGNILWSAP
jgi:hypothetical protein